MLEDRFVRRSAVLPKPMTFRRLLEDMCVGRLCANLVRDVWWFGLVAMDGSVLSESSFRYLFDDKSRTWFSQGRPREVFSISVRGLVCSGDDSDMSFR